MGIRWAGQDELVSFGGSFAMNAQGELFGEGGKFVEQTLLVNPNGTAQIAPPVSIWPVYTVPWCWACAIM